MANRSKQSDKAKASAKTGAKTSGRDSLVKLRSHVEDIEKRLKRANSLTKSSVTALTTSFERLHAETGSDKNSQRLAQYIDDLAAQLNGLIEQTRKDVAHDLKVVMSDPRMETVSAALTKANQRLTRAETQQADAIGAINGQIAKLAKAIDARMRREVRAREQSHAALEAKISSSHETLETNYTELGTRIEAVETLSADAVKTIGDKVVSVTEELQQQTQTLKQDVGAQGLDLQKGYEEHKEEMARRIESLEDDQRNTIPSLERRLVTLATRIEVLEDHGPTQFSSSSASPPASLEGAPLEIVSAPPFAEPHLTNIETVQLAEPFAPFVSEGTPMQADAFSPNEPVNLTNVAPPQNPYDQPVEEAVLDLVSGTNAPAVVKPVEYVPEEYAPEAYTPEIYVADTSAPHTMAPVETVQYPAEYSAPTHAPFNVETGAFEQVTNVETPPPPFAAGVPPMPTALSSAQIADQTQSMPAQAMPAESMYEARPGAEPEKKSRFKRTKSAKKSKKVKSANTRSGGIPAPLRIGGLMVGVAVVGLFAAKTILPKVIGNTAKPTAQTSATARPIATVTNEQTLGAGQEAPATTQSIQSVDTVGDYSQTMQAPDLGTDVNGTASSEKLSLEAAATKGEPIAQFQLGLSHLEAGRNAQAVRLIQLAANQDQAAAQYRLGKLYEAGVGVDANLATAMDLLEKSAASGNRIAMHDLGHYHATGAAGAPDMETAVSWFTKAAERGVLDSQFNLGVLYQGQSGTQRDPVASYAWFAIAGAQGDKVAAQRSELMARSLNPAQLEAGKARVAAFTPTQINDAANGVFRDLPWAPQKVAQMRNVDTAVQGAQAMLSKLGYDVGTPDGAMGPRTRNAVISFERANGLPETGRINAALIDRLSLASGA